MNRKFRSKFFGLVAFQVLLVLTLIGYKYYTMATGILVELQTVPVDPRDMFRGEYVALSYNISTIPEYLYYNEDYKAGDTVYVTIRRQGRFWNVASVSRKTPDEGLIFLKGTVTNNPRPATEHAPAIEMHIKYGIESYFVEQGQGKELERLRSRQLITQVVVDSQGRAVLKGVQPVD